MRTVDAVIGGWERVYASYGLPWTTGNKHLDCPLCKSKKSFRITDRTGNGDWICKCGAGVGWSLLHALTGKDFRDLAKEVDAIIGNSYKSTPKDIKEKAGKNNLAEMVKNYFVSLDYIRDTQAHDYLMSRGIYETPRAGIRYSPGEFDHDEKKKFACIYALASDDYGVPAFKHITYLENGKKANIATQRKLFTIKETQGSVAIKFSQAGSVLGIAEGIESALSAAQLYKLPVWSTISAAIMQKFRAPTGVKSLYIFADNDKNGTGLASAFACGKSNILANNDVEKVFIRWPLKVNDFNDMLTAGDEVVEWILKK